MARDGDTTKDRVIRLEKLVGVDAPDAEEALLNRMDRLVEAVKYLQGQVEDLRTKHDEMSQDTAAMAEVQRQESVAQSEEITLLKRAVLDQPQGQVGRTRMKVPEPKSFGGARSAKELENFVWDVEEYFTAAQVADADRVSIAAMYLVGDAKLWWRIKVQERTLADRPRITAWDEMKKELRGQFLPTNTNWSAREALRDLEQTGSVREYITGFSSLLLDVTEMSEADKLFNFMAGLQPWAQRELRRQNVQSLSAAVAAADALVELRGDQSSSSKVKNYKKDKTVKPKAVAEPSGKSSADSDKPADDRGKSGQGSKTFACFICGEPHRARDCPKRERIAALILEEDEDTDEEDMRIGSLQLQQSPKESTRTSSSSGGGGL